MCLRIEQFHLKSRQFDGIAHCFDMLTFSEKKTFFFRCCNFDLTVLSTKICSECRTSFRSMFFPG